VAVRVRRPRVRRHGRARHCRCRAGRLGGSRLRAGGGGRNYGWRNREGAHPNVGTLPPYFLPLRDPIHEYSHAEGGSITGGTVYRGANLGAFYNGRYFFGDFVFGRIWSLGLSLDMSGEATVVSVIEHTAALGQAAQNPSSFGVDANGELYVVSYAGRVYRLVLELVGNGDFGNGMAGWMTFATPDPSYIVGGVVAGVFEFYRVPPPPGSTNQAVVFQQTGVAAGPWTRFRARFDLGNSSTERKRISVLIHDANFNDVAVCTFWLAPGQPLAPYVMRGFSTMFWTNATISVYPSTVDTEPWIRLDNVTFHQTPAQGVAGTECVEPGLPAAGVAARPSSTIGERGGWPVSRPPRARDER